MACFWSRLPVDYLTVHLVPFIRALLMVVRVLPPHCAKERRSLLATLLRLLRRCLFLDVPEDQVGRTGPAARLA
jgi:hypothetical protein